MLAPDIFSPTKNVGDKYRGTRHRVRNRVSDLLIISCKQAIADTNIRSKHYGKNGNLSFFEECPR